MPRDALYTRVLEHITQVGEEGLRLENLRSLEPNASDRQLRYRLNQMRQEGEIRRVGRGPSTRYVAASRSSPAERIQEGALFSTHARELLSQLALPPSARAIARYDERWLTHVGTSPLLSDAQRAHLNGIGQTGLEEELAGIYARQLSERLLIDLSWASSALEGNTYSLLDTRRLIETGLEATGKEKVEAQMILNHKLAIEFLLDNVTYGIRHGIVANLNAILLDNLIKNQADGGKLRSRGVRISGATYLPLNIPQKLTEEFERLLAFARAKQDPFERAFFLLVTLPYLQPFIDGNKRTGRLMANLPLFIANVRPLSFVDIERDDYLEATLCVYEFGELSPLRELFIFAYERSCARYPDVLEALPEPDEFRLEHRALVYEAVRQVVAELEPDRERAVEEFAAEHFESLPDRVRFGAMVLADLRSLHEGNYMRYRIRPAEFEEWRDTMTKDQGLYDTPDRAGEG